MAPRTLPIVLLAALLAVAHPGCGKSTPKQPEAAPPGPTEAASPPDGGTKPATGNAPAPDGFALYSPEWSGTFFDDMFIFFGGDRPPARAMAKIRDTHNLTDWTYRHDVEGAVETSREGVQELARSDYQSWDETALIVSLVSTIAIRDPAAVVRTDAISTLTWFREWIHEDTIKMGRGIVASEDDVIKALKVLDDMKGDATVLEDPRKTMVLLDAISMLGSHPWDELASDRPAIIKTSLSRPRGVIGRLTKPDLTSRRGNAQVRDTLDRALLRVSDEVVILTMMAAMSDSTPYVRASAAKALFLARDTRAVGPLIATLRGETDDDARLEVVKALGASAFGESRRRAIPALAEMLMDTSVSVRQAATSELERLTGAGIGPDVSAWLRWWKEHEKEYGRR